MASRMLVSTLALVFVNSYNVLLMQALGGKTESSGLGDVFDSHTRHLTVPHCTFLRHWERLINLEAKEIELARDTLRIAFSPTNTMDCTLRSRDYVSYHLVKMVLVLMVY
ncbi:hypothetical protein CJ030_MR5G011899 [Morella rubra]|uniref:Uncharacterized protein n=1 Tax=Morella rubra TaxID=262757 RepID=A0A6A1VIS2_9ROSI|nr:hypothetical protein CJ030_MR0G002165 [Morella rubra]KAB1212799.1 hypothetical protein CJ030_MR5G011899 [Morella rubra]